MKLKKSLSQNLIRDRKILVKMVKGSGIGRQDRVIEIGAGQGDLTRVLCEHAGSVHAIEFDHSFFPRLAQIESEHGNLKIVHGDVLTMDLATISGETTDVTVFGNIPYGITGPILFKILEGMRVIRRAFLTMQREVAERLVSPSHRRSYGALSVIFQLYADTKLLFVLKPGVFTPLPKVDSAFVAIRFRENVRGADEGLVGFVKHSFENKRKYLHYALAKRYDETLIDRTYRIMGFPASVRAEEIEPAQFVEMYRVLSEEGA